MKPKPPTCEGCPLHHVGQSFVPAIGPSSPKAIIIGQGPGRYEAQFGEPFISSAPAGAKLDRWLARSTPWSRDDVYLTNVIWCWYYSKRDLAPPAKAVAHCRRVHWGTPLAERLSSRQLDDGTSAVPIITLGAPATKALLGPQAGERWNGSLELVEIT